MTQEAITIDATVGGASSNSFLTLAACDTYLHQKPFHSGWDDITDVDQREAAIIWASRTLSNMKWKGLIVDLDQALSFPRSGIYDHDSRQFSTTAIPEWLEVATSELAFYMATEDRLADSGTEGFSKIKVASITLDIDRSDRSGVVPDYVMDMVRPYLYASSQVNARVKRV